MRGSTFVCVGGPLDGRAITWEDEPDKLLMFPQKASGPFPASTDYYQLNLEEGIIEYIGGQSE